MRTAVATAYLLALAVWLGTIVFHSFVVAPALFRTLPQTTAGDVVSRIFPAYYLVGYVCGAIAVAAPRYLTLSAPGEPSWRWASMIAAILLALTLVAGAVIPPRAAALRRELPAAAADAPVRKQFRQLHQMAVVANLLVLASGLGLVVVVARQLR